MEVEVIPFEYDKFKVKLMCHYLLYKVMELEENMESAINSLIECMVTKGEDGKVMRSCEMVSGLSFNRFEIWQGYK